MANKVLNEEELKNINDIKELVSLENLSKIISIVRDVNIRTAITSLIIWGIINIVAWFIIGSDNQRILNELSTPSIIQNNATPIDIYILLYSNILLGSLMFLFAFIGFISRATIVILFDSIALFVIGIWNISYQFIANAILKSYGYTVEQQSVIWIMLGLSQCYFGYRQLLIFTRIIKSSPANIPSIELSQLKEQVQKFISLATNKEEGIVDVGITKKGFPGLAFTSQTTQYIGRLFENSCLMISTKLNDYFIIEKTDMRRASFDNTDIFVAIDDDSEQKMECSSLAVEIFKEWSGRT